MSHHNLYEERDRFFIKPSSRTKTTALVFLLIGVISLAAGFASGQLLRSWGSFLFNLMFFFSISLGGVAFGSMQDVIGAKWGRPIKRVHESFGAFLPFALGGIIFYLLAIQFNLLEASKIYKWIADPHMLEHFDGKKDWLKPGFMIGRDIIAAVLILLLARWHFSQTLEADRAMLAGKKDQAKLIGKANTQKLRYWSAPVLLAYGILFSLLCFDLTMSLAPTWMSTLWGGWSFALMMHSLFALTLLVMFSLRNTAVGAYIKRQQFHDVGKLMHGFTAFFAYLTYAHVLTYWYINMPEETSYFHTRLAEPWIYFVMASPILCFVIPIFSLIPKVSKWGISFTVPICLTILLAQWINYMLVVMPEVIEPHMFGFPWIELGTFLGFLGGFGLTVMAFASRNPMIAIGDPLLEESLASHH